MVDVKAIMQRILGGTDDLFDTFEYEWRKEKDDLCRKVHNDIINILRLNKVSWIEALAVLEMVKWEYLNTKHDSVEAED